MWKSDSNTVEEKENSQWLLSLKLNTYIKALLNIFSVAQCAHSYLKHIFSTNTCTWYVLISHLFKISWSGEQVKLLNVQITIFLDPHWRSLLLCFQLTDFILSSSYFRRLDWTVIGEKSMPVLLKLESIWSASSLEKL